MYGGTFDEPGLVLCQLVKNGVVVGANEDFLRAANPAHITAAKANVSESTKAYILLPGANGQK